MNKGTFSVILSFLAIFFAGISAFSLEMNFENSSFTIGSMTLLIAILVGWHIFNSIELKRKIEEVNKIGEDILLTKTEISVYNFKTMGNLYTMVGYIHFSEKFYLEAYEDYVNALWNFLHIIEEDNKVRQIISERLTDMKKCIEALKKTKNDDLRMTDPLTFNGNVRNIIESHSSNFTKEYREIFFQLESERKKYYNKESQI